MHQVYHSENLAVLRSLAGGSANLIYIDPPFNTGRPRRLSQLQVVRASQNAGDRTGFKGARYETSAGPVREYDDRFDDFTGFLRPRLEEAYRVLASFLTPSSRACRSA